MNSNPVSPLRSRWSSPSPEQNRALGLALWGDLRQSSWTEIVSEDNLLKLVDTLLTAVVSAVVWDEVPRALVHRHVTDLRHSGDTLADLLGPSGCDRLRQIVAAPSQHNPDLALKLLDQPLLRQALRDTLQRGIQSYVSNLSSSLPFSREKVGPSGGMMRGMLGEFSRGIAQKARDSVAVGKTWAESVGITAAIEENIQPFLQGYGHRALKGLVEQIFSGEQEGAAREARLGALEILLETPLHDLLSQPDKNLVDLHLQLGASVAGHLATRESYRKLVQELTRGFYSRLATETVAQTLTRLRLPEEVPPLTEALGQLAHHALSRPNFMTWLESELSSTR